MHLDLEVIKSLVIDLCVVSSYHTTRELCSFDQRYKLYNTHIMLFINRLNHMIQIFTTKKTKISEGYLVRENVKSLSNSVTKFYDQAICEEFHLFRH